MISNLVFRLNFGKAGATEIGGDIGRSVMNIRIVIPAVLVLAGCSDMPLVTKQPEPAVQEEVLRPKARPDTLTAPPANARTVEQFDTTTAEERAEAAAPSTSGETKLGDTVASLGDPSKPGFWLETPLVSQRVTGRVFFPGSGRSAQVDLLPIAGEATAGSRISLAAMRILEAPLTDLPTIQVFTGG
jgi:hypothetical protein